MNSPVFSIIMPAWNRANCITPAIQSVLAQTFSGYELLIIDDGSDDGLEQTVQPFLSENILYYKRPRSGVSAARNFGLEQARGTYIAYLDSDNTWHPGFLATMFSALNKKPGYHAAYCKCNRFKKDAAGRAGLHSVLGEEFDFKKMVYENYIDLNTFVHTKTALSGHIRFDESLKRLTDWDFILKVTMLHTPVFVKKILADYNQGFQHNTITCNEDLFKPLIQTKERYREFDTRTAEINHDGVMYRFEGLPDKKYYNYLKTARQSEWNTKDFTAPGFPYMLQIEPTNFCNLSCTVCPAAANKRDLNRVRRHLRLDEFKKIVDAMEDYLLLLVMWDWGEPFMNPELPEMLRYASNKGIKTVTSTNAHFLNDTQYLERILTSGLTALIISIDSLNQDSYEFYRRGGNLAQAMDGLNNVLALKKKLTSTTLVNLRMVLMKNNESELADMRKAAKKLNVDIFSVKTANPTCAGTLNDEHIVPAKPERRRYAYKPKTFERIRTGGPCTLPWFMFNIHSNGNIVPCCYDYDEEMIIGNAFEAPLPEIWNSRACRDLRQKLFYDKDTLPKCRECAINFKLSKTGWIVEITDCSLSPKRRLFIELRNAVEKILPSKAVNLLYRGYCLLAKDAAGLKHHRTPASRHNAHLHSHICSLHLPLPVDHKRGWNPVPLFSGPTKALFALKCHASSLVPDYSPHPPHAHPEEELLLLLSGELELVVPDEKNSQKLTRVCVKPLQVLFYPAGFAHTVKTISAEPANYLMLKWQNKFRDDSSALSFGSFNLSDSEPDATIQDGFSPRLIFEGPTAYLKKLHCHVTTLAPQAGYSPHKDPYDVVIVVLDGEVETLGQRARPHDVIFYAAGEPHGMRNPSHNTVARYAVFEFHGT